MDAATKQLISLSKRAEFIKNFPCFSTLTATQCQELAELMQEVNYVAQQKIVIENELVNSVFIIVSGDAEVSHQIIKRKKVKQIPIAKLRAGEAIGLNDSGFYSETGKRTATVTALTNMTLLRLELKDLSEFLKKNNLESTMYAASKQMLCMAFIKQCLPFAKLSHQRLQWLADHVQEITFPPETILFEQGEAGDKCYMVRSGKVEVFVQNAQGEKQVLAVLKPPVLFGEATLITRSPRNATAKILEEANLLVINQENLSELIESEDNVAKMFMTLMVDRSRPIQNPHVTLHSRTTSDGQEITILKNPDNDSYFKLSQEGAFIWQQLDGEHTLQQITLDLASKFNVFAPDMVAALIYKLTKSGFITNLEITDTSKLSNKPIWVRVMVKLRQVLEKRFAFGDADKWVSRIYQRYIKFLFTKPGQVILVLTSLFGFFAFAVSTNNVLSFFSVQHANLLLLLVLIPLSFAEALLHELGHAFAVKAFGYEVHYIGVGWYWLGPIAFTDTSDMWLATRKPRMWVNLAGVYVDAIIAGIAGLLIFVIPNLYLQAMLWLFALYTYIGAFRMLSPLQEMDGYYVLMDWVERDRLRQEAVLWLVKKLPRSIKTPRLFRENKPEIIYWLSCLIFLFLISLLTLVVQTFVFKVMGIQSANPYLTLILPVLVVIFSSLSIIADIQNQKEE